MKRILKRQHCLIFEIALILLINPVNSFSKDILFGDAGVTDTVVSEIVNDFLSAVNAGERKTMQDFILMHYDQNALKRIPLFAGDAADSAVLNRLRDIAIPIKIFRTEMTTIRNVILPSGKDPILLKQLTGRFAIQVQIMCFYDLNPAIRLPMNDGIAFMNHQTRSLTNQ